MHCIGGVVTIFINAMFGQLAGTNNRKIDEKEANK